MPTASDLTAAFNAGVAAHKDGHGISGRFAYTGKARDFWLAGWHKADKAARDAYNAPAAVAARKADALAARKAAQDHRAAVLDAIQTSEVNALLAGRILTPADRLRIACNANIGIVTKF